MISKVKYIFLSFFLFPCALGAQDFEYNAALGYLVHPTNSKLSVPKLGLGMNWIINDDSYLFLTYQFDFALPRQTNSNVFLRNDVTRELSSEVVNAQYKMNRIGLNLYVGKYFGGKLYTQGFYAAAGFRIDYFRARHFKFAAYDNTKYTPVYEEKHSVSFEDYAALTTANKVKMDGLSFVVVAGYSYTVKQVIYRFALMPGLMLDDETRLLNQAPTDFIVSAEFMISYIFEDLFLQRKVEVEKHKNRTGYF